ncbi:MAG: hydrogenase maturation nickel metallochaperone HypA [Pseudomonadota bacterium]
MHELSIAQTIIETVAEKAVENGFTKVASAKLRIGKMAAFQREQLEFCLSSYEKAPALEGMSFDIEEVPVELACAPCGKRFADSRFDDCEFAHHIAHAPALYLPPDCPACSSGDVSVVAGREMELSSIEGE